MATRKNLAFWANRMVPTPGREDLIKRNKEILRANKDHWILAFGDARGFRTCASFPRPSRDCGGTGISGRGNSSSRVYYLTPLTKLLPVIGL